MSATKTGDTHTKTFRGRKRNDPLSFCLRDSAWERLAPSALKSMSFSRDPYTARSVFLRALLLRRIEATAFPNCVNGFISL